jgi:hypothetical protein
MEQSGENERNRRTQAIEQWMLDVAGKGGERLDDLHIDRIDSNWKSRECWIEGALATFQIAMDLRGLHGFPFTVAVVFSLTTDTKRIGPAFRTLRELERQLDWTPPSLYLFQRGKEPWLANTDFQQVEDVVVGNQRHGVTWWYSAFKSGSADEYSRTVFCQG